MCIRDSSSAVSDQQWSDRRPALSPTGAMRKRGRNVNALDLGPAQSSTTRQEKTGSPSATP
eukprot:7166581-Alexandrium_andersonii.AAC.1